MKISQKHLIYVAKNDLLGYAGPDNVNNGLLMKLSDISVTSGTISDGQTLPIPQGFEQSECQFLLSVNQSNVSSKILLMVMLNLLNVKCYREGLVVRCGTEIIVQDRIEWNGGGGANPNRSTKHWTPGTANYICIAVKKA